MELKTEIQELAKDFLKAALYRARESLHRNDSLNSKSGFCGLGDTAPMPQDLPEEHVALLKYFSSERLTQRRGLIPPLLQRWISDFDPIDRANNHFLKRFRQKHGFDRRRYDDRVEQAFTEGLRKIHAEQEEVLNRHAAELVALLTE